MQRMTALLILLMLISGAVMAAEMPEEMQGTWTIHHDESMALMKTSPKYKEAEHDAISRRIKKRAPRIKLTVASSSITIEVGKRSQELPFSVVSSTTKEVKIKAKTKVATKTGIKEKDVDLTLKLIKDKYLQMISSASDDMNYYAWEKKEVKADNASVGEKE